MFIYKYQKGQEPDFIKKLKSEGLVFNKQERTGGETFAVPKVCGILNPAEYSNDKTFIYPNLEGYEGVGVLKIDTDFPEARHRKQKLIGSPVRVADNIDLTLPKLRVLPSGSQLPNKLKLVEGGVAFEVKPRFLKAWAWGDKIYEMLVKGETPNNEVIQCLLEVFSINYYLTIYDIIEYLFDPEWLHLVLAYLIDCEDLLSPQEAPKKAPASPFPRLQTWGEANRSGNL